MQPTKIFLLVDHIYLPYDTRHFGTTNYDEDRLQNHWWLVLFYRGVLLDIEAGIDDG